MDRVLWALPTKQDPTLKLVSLRSVLPSCLMTFEMCRSCWAVADSCWLLLVHSDTLRCRPGFAFSEGIIFLLKQGPDSLDLSRTAKCGGSFSMSLWRSNTNTYTTSAKVPEKNAVMSSNYKLRFLFTKYWHYIPWKIWTIIKTHQNFALYFECFHFIKYHNSNLLWSKVNIALFVTLFCVSEYIAVNQLL